MGGSFRCADEQSFEKCCLPVGLDYAVPRNVDEYARCWIQAEIRKSWTAGTILNPKGSSLTDAKPSKKNAGKQTSKY